MRDSRRSRRGSGGRNKARDGFVFEFAVDVADMVVIVVFAVVAVVISDRKGCGRGGAKAGGEQSQRCGQCH